VVALISRKRGLNNSTLGPTGFRGIASVRPNRLALGPQALAWGSRTAPTSPARRQGVDRQESPYWWEAHRCRPSHFGGEAGARKHSCVVVDPGRVDSTPAALSTLPAEGNAGRGVKRV